MIKISAPLKQEEIKELLNSHDEYEFVEKQGINLIFKTTIEDTKQAAKNAENLITAEPWGAVLFIDVRPI